VGPARIALRIAEEDHRDIEGQHAEKQPAGFLQQAGDFFREGERTSGRTIEHELAVQGLAGRSKKQKRGEAPRF
jgi:hypothetical protein